MPHRRALELVFDPAGESFRGLASLPYDASVAALGSLTHSGMPIEISGQKLETPTYVLADQVTEAGANPAAAAAGEGKAAAADVHAVGAPGGADSTSAGAGAAATPAAHAKANQPLPIIDIKIVRGNDALPAGYTKITQSLTKGMVANLNARVQGPELWLCVLRALPEYVTDDKEREALAKAAGVSLQTYIVKQPITDVCIINAGFEEKMPDGTQRKRRSKAG